MSRTKELKTHGNYCISNANCSSQTRSVMASIRDFVLKHKYAKKRQSQGKLFIEENT